MKDHQYLPVHHLTPDKQVSWIEGNARGYTYDQTCHCCGTVSVQLYPVLISLIDSRFTPG